LRHKGVAKPSYEVLTLLWHEVVGDVQFDFCGPCSLGKEWPIAMVTGGTINVDGYTKKTRKNSMRTTKAFSLAKMAAYVSKYLTKHHAEGLEGRRMWDSTQDLTPPKPSRLNSLRGLSLTLSLRAFECPLGTALRVTG
jgi:hypothetical protein